MFVKTRQQRHRLSVSQEGFYVSRKGVEIITYTGDFDEKNYACLFVVCGRIQLRWLACLRAAPVNSPANGRATLAEVRGGQTMYGLIQRSG